MTSRLMEYQISLGDIRRPLFHVPDERPESVQTFEPYPTPNPGEPIRMAHFIDQDVSHMERPPSRLSCICSVHDSDIDLEGQMAPIAIALQRMVSPTTATFFTQSPQTLSEYGGPSSRIIAGPSQPFHYQPNDDGRSSLPDTQAATCSSPTSDVSSTPLLR